MNFPFHFRIGSVEIPVHLALEVLAFWVGYRYYLFLRKRCVDLIDTENRMWILVGAAAGALLLSRGLGVLEDPAALWRGDFKPVYLLGNQTVVGGLLGGLIGVELTKQRLGIRTSSGDLMTFPLILGMIIGRVGCFLSGLEDKTFGIATDLPWGIDFGDGIRRHPTNLYEILFLLLLWVGIAQLEKTHRLANGARFKLFLASYLLFRFLIEFIKPAYFFPFGLSVIQLATLGGLAYYYKVFCYPQRLLEPNVHA